MKYYYLTNNIKLRETGCFPQVETYKIYGSIRDYGRISKIIEDVILPEPIMLPKAKSSTYLSSGISQIRFLTLKNHFIDFLSNFDIGDFQTWNIKVHHRSRVLKDYSLFHLSNPMQNYYVDYASSEFHIRKIEDRKHRGKSIKVKNAENYLSINEILYNDGYWLVCDRLIFNFSTATEDMFRLTDVPSSPGYYVSERLKNAIEKERFTGMEFKEIEEYNKKIEVIY